MGRRLGERGHYRPKGFLRLGKRYIIEESLDRLTTAGIERVIIVTGHQAEFYHRLKKQYPGLIETVHNPVFSKSGSMYSLYCTQGLIDSNFLLLESDLIFEQRALDLCLRFPLDNVLLLSGFSGSEGEICVEVADGRLRTMFRQRDELVREAAGEFVGISKISNPLYKVMLNQAEIIFPKTLNVDYDTDCLVSAAQRYPVYCFLDKNLIWSDIDTEAQLKWVSEKVYPLILQGTDGLIKGASSH